MKTISMLYLSAALLVPIASYSAGVGTNPVGTTNAGTVGGTAAPGNSLGKPIPGGSLTDTTPPPNQANQAGTAGCDCALSGATRGTTAGSSGTTLGGTTGSSNCVCTGTGGINSGTGSTPSQGRSSQ